MSTCPVADETCQPCPYCVGGEFIPTTAKDCRCNGTGCCNESHWNTEAR